MMEQGKSQKRHYKIIFYLSIFMLLFSITGCANENHTTRNKKNNIEEKSAHLNIEYLSNDELMSNNPYNSYSAYLDGYTYIKKGMSICRIFDDSDEMQQVYADENALGMGFAIHEKELYVYKILEDQDMGDKRTEVIRMELDGTSQVSFLTYDGITVEITFYQDNMYLWRSGLREADAYKGYHLDENSNVEELGDNEKFLYHKVNENFKEEDNLLREVNFVLEPTFSMKHYGGIFYKEHQKSELPVWDISFESEENIMDAFVEYYEDILITPYGIYKVSQEGDSILQCELDGKDEKEVFANPEPGLELQLFTYDESGIYFCIYGQDGGGTVYHISGEDGEANALFQLQEAGVSYNKQDSTQGNLCLNVQNGYVYVWTDFLGTVVRQRI